MAYGRNSISGTKLSYYFDQVKKDRSDLQESATQWEEWLRLRPKVLSLPHDTFKVTLAAVEAILEHASKQSNQANSKDAQRQSRDQKAASSLYEEVRKEIREKDLSIKSIE